jgi:hypothetical protein
MVSLPYLFSGLANMILFELLRNRQDGTGNADGNDRRDWVNRPRISTTLTLVRTRGGFVSLYQTWIQLSICRVPVFAARRGSRLLVDAVRRRPQAQ